MIRSMFARKPYLASSYCLAFAIALAPGARAGLATWDGDGPPLIDAPTREGEIITLRSGRAAAQALRCRWVQTEGRPIELEDADQPVARFVSPATDEALEFVLVAAGEGTIETESVVVRDVEERVALLDEPEAPATPPTPSAESPVEPGLAADAGDDQVGLPGHRITLNAMRSRPQQGLIYRWFQAAGPPVRDAIADGYIYSFVPSVSGSYRFGLVVALGGEISEPDLVDLVVTSSEAGSSPPAGLTALAAPTATPTAAQVAEECRRGLASLADGPARAEWLADAFLGVADRMGLYATYGDVYREIAHRLTGVVPEDEARRAEWLQRVFQPMSVRLVERLRAERLDLAAPGGQDQPLTESQRLALVEIYRAAAWGFRQAGPAMVPAPTPSTPGPTAALMPEGEGLR